MQNPVATGVFVKHSGPNASPDLETAKMIKSIPLINTGEDLIGWMRGETWDVMAQSLREQGLLTKPLGLEPVYTMQLLKEIYSE